MTSKSPQSNKKPTRSLYEQLERSALAEKGLSTNELLTPSTDITSNLPSFLDFCPVEVTDPSAQELAVAPIEKSKRSAQRTQEPAPSFLSALGGESPDFLGFLDTTTSPITEQPSASGERVPSQKSAQSAKKRNNNTNSNASKAGNSTSSPKPNRNPKPASANNTNSSNTSSHQQPIEREENGKHRGGVLNVTPQQQQATGRVQKKDHRSEREPSNQETVDEFDRSSIVPLPSNKTPIPSPYASKTSVIPRSIVENVYCVLDTNIYLHNLPDAEVIVNISSVRLVVPITVTRELDGLKKNEQKSALAQQANKFLLKYSSKLIGQLPHETVASTEENVSCDELIIRCASYFQKNVCENTILVSNDKNLQVHAILHMGMKALSSKDFIREHKRKKGS